MAWTSAWLEYLFHKNDTNKMNKNVERKETFEKIKFQSLTPLNNIEDESSFQALDYALSKDDIHNIAITGNYGSGKSSIINTYFKDRLKNDCLKISLATFAIEKKNDGQIPNSTITQIPDTTIQEIEKSILQQIFYKKSGNAFPFSRFNRIKNYGFRKILLIQIVLYPIFLLGLKIIKNEWWTHFLNCLTCKYSVQSCVLSVLALIASFIAMYFIIRSFGRIKLNKFSFIKAEFGLGDINNESLLNKYIDELLYFFEISKYKIIIFEDLDRFENTEIFIKLRELNTILNNYEKINRTIVFIYALKDEVFTNSNRTKFFDFIIPVIPVINSQNSMDILLNIQKQNPNTAFSEVNTDFLQDIGLYVDDMRLLINCINEFRIYDEKINKSCLGEKNREFHKRTLIFALILYKNLYPKDFAELTFNRGFLYNIFQKKDEMVQSEILELENQNKTFEAQLKQLEEYDGFLITQLRRSYLEAIISEIKSFYINPRSIETYLSDQEFSQLISKGKITLPTYNYGNMEHQFNWGVIQKKVNSNYSYDENESFIRDNSNGKKETLSNTIKENNVQINKLRTSPIKNLHSLSQIVDEIITEESGINQKLIHFLLSNGYIDENYFDYISNFYPEAISNNDKQFLLLIKNNSNPNFNLQLTKIKNIISRIRENEWNHFAILNNDLLSYLLKNDDSKKLTQFISVMYTNDMNSSGAKFFVQYNNSNNEYVKRFDICINQFVVKNNLDYKVFFSSQNYDRFFTFFLNVNTIGNTKLQAFTKQNTKFLARDIDEENMHQVIQKLKEINLCIPNISSLKGFPILKEIVNNNMYEITRDNLITIIESINSAKVEHNRIISDIEKINNPIITEYIESDKNILIDSILTPESENLEETEEVIISLLNNEEVTHDRKEFLVKSNTTPITDLSKVNRIFLYETEDGQMQLNIWDLLFQENKVKPTWNSIYTYYKESNKLSNELIGFIENNISELSNDTVITDEEKKDNKSEKYQLVEKIFRDLLGCNEFNLDAYEHILSICPLWYGEIDNYDLDETHLLALCISGRITLTEKNYNEVRAHSNEACNRLLCRYFDNLFTDQTIDYVKDEDILYLITTDLITAKQKIRAITSEIIDWNIVDDKKVINKIVDLIIVNKLEIKVLLPLKKLLEVLNEKSKDNNKKIIELILLQANHYSRTEMHDALLSIDRSYSDLLEDGTTEKPLEKTSDNEKLCELFKRKKWILSYYTNSRGELKIRRLR